VTLNGDEINKILLVNRSCVVVRARRALITDWVKGRFPGKPAFITADFLHLKRLLGSQLLSIPLLINPLRHPIQGYHGFETDQTSEEFLIHQIFVAILMDVVPAPKSPVIIF
jgi:hypothetical protein